MSLICPIEIDGTRFSMLRLDLIDPGIPGNKWFKLKYNLEAARHQGYSTLLTFGGAYSNHIAAVAAAARRFGFKSIGIIRGEEQPVLNPVLTFAGEAGMELHYISREAYRKKGDAGFAEGLRNDFGDHYLIPEGGTNELAVKGCMEILPAVDEHFDLICCAVGTGGTIAGIIRSLKPGQQALGFPVLKGADFLEKEIEMLSGKAPGGNWRLEYNYHFGGYAKSNADLEAFLSSFGNRNGILLDHVYMGKLMYGVYDLFQKNVFKGRKVLVLHSGGFRIN